MSCELLGLALPTEGLQFLSGRDGLLYVNGTAPGLASGNGNFYQGAKSIPSPLFITRATGSGPRSAPQMTSWP